MNYLYDAYSRYTHWCMYCSISIMSMIDVWYSCKLWEMIFRSVRGLSLAKARIHAGLIHRSSVYIVKLDTWSCRWVWWLLQSSVSALCSSDGVVNRVSVIQSLMIVLSFNDSYGSSMKIGWNVAFQIMCCASVYPVWKLMKRGTWRREDCRQAPMY